MTTTSNTFFNADYVATTTQLIYQADAAVTAKVESAIATNVTASTDATVTIYAVEAGGVPGASNTIVSAQRVRPGTAFLMPELRGQTFEPGEAIYAIASDANAIVLRVSGLEIV